MPRHLKLCQTYDMTDSDGDLFSEEAMESAVYQYSSFLDIQLEVLEDSGDLDYSEKQFLERSELAFIGDEDLESAIAHDEAIAKIVYGRISESEKLKLASASSANQINRHRKRSTVAVTTDHYLVLGI